MEHVLRIALAVLIFFFYVSPAVAQQQDIASLAVWRGLVIDHSTPDDAIRLLGSPSSNKMTALSVNLIDRWLDAKHKEKIFTTLTFKKAQGLEGAQLSFLDNKLVMLRLDTKAYDDPNWIDPDRLAMMFAAEFTPLVKFLSKRMPSLKDYSPEKERAPKKDLDGMYDMLALTGRSFIIARVDNGAFGRSSLTRGSWQRRDKELKEMSAAGEYPGEVMFIQIVSRSLTAREQNGLLRKGDEYFRRA